MDTALPLWILSEIKGKKHLGMELVKNSSWGTFHFSLVILATASRVSHRHKVSSLINPITVCEAALGLHPIRSISKVKGYASNLVVKHVYPTGTQSIRWNLGKTLQDKWTSFFSK